MKICSLFSSRQMRALLTAALWKMPGRCAAVSPFAFPQEMHRPAVLLAEAGNITLFCPALSEKACQLHCMLWELAVWSCWKLMGFCQKRKKLSHGKPELEACIKSRSQH